MYLGNQPALSYTSFAKQDFTTSATTSYTLDNPVTNANELALFINFVRQEPTTAYSASGTNLILTSATSASDDMYCVYLGKAVQTVNPPNASVGLSQLTATGTKDATTFLRGDNTFDTPPLGGITMADIWRINSQIDISTYNTNVDITNWERADTNAPGFIGTGLTESSGIFSFPSTGIYQIYLQYAFQSNVNNSYNGVHINTTTDNSNYNNATENYVGLVNNAYNSASAQFIFDVTNTSTHKIKFSYFVQGSVSLLGSSNDQRTGFTVIRLGDT